MLASDLLLRISPTLAVSDGSRREDRAQRENPSSLRSLIDELLDEPARTRSLIESLQWHRMEGLDSVIEIAHGPNGTGLGWVYFDAAKMARVDGPLAAAQAPTWPAANAMLEVTDAVPTKYDLSKTYGDYCAPN